MFKFVACWYWYDNENDIWNFNHISTGFWEWFKLKPTPNSQEQIKSWGNKLWTNKASVMLNYKVDMLA